MSFVHSVYVGHPNEGGQKHSRCLTAEECLEWMRRYNETAEERLHVTISPDPEGPGPWGLVLGSVDGQTVLLKSGQLQVPYLSIGYIRAAVAFVRFMATTAGYAIYEPCDGRALTPTEFGAE